MFDSFVDGACVDGIDKRLAAYASLVDRIPIVAPDFIAASFPYDSGVPGAAVCLRDCQRTLGQALFALHQMCAQAAQHRTANPPNLMMAAWIERFYLEDSAMRLYSAAEHLAHAVELLLALDPDELSTFKTPSHWERVRRALKVRDSAHPITVAITNLRSGQYWSVAVRYRGHVVHNQPPNLEGLGIQYNRGPRWEASADESGMALHVRRGDKAAHKPEEVIEFVVGAFAEFLPVATAVTDALFDTMSAHGIKWDGNQTLSLSPFSNGA